VGGTGNENPKAEALSINKRGIFDVLRH